MNTIDFHPYCPFPGMPIQHYEHGSFYWGSLNGTLGQATYNNGWCNFSPLNRVSIEGDYFILQTEAGGPERKLKITSYPISDNLTTAVVMTTHKDIHFLKIELYPVTLVNGIPIALDAASQTSSIELDNEEIQLATLFVDICKRPELVRPFVGKALAQGIVETYEEDSIKVVPFFALLMRRLLLESNCYNKDKLLPEGSDAYKVAQVGSFLRRVVAVANKVPLMLNLVIDDSTWLHYLGLFNTLCGDGTATGGS